jgi:hypothetical protein
MIKEIHTFGTSFTAGGGYFFDIPEEILNSEAAKREGLRERVQALHDTHTEEPKTMLHYSWPGQLQVLLGDDVKVYNHAKEGFGNETMYRITNDILWEGNNFIDCDDKIFIYEFSGLGRKEFWSNTIKDYCVLNYGSMSKSQRDSNFVHVQQQYKINNGTLHLSKYKEDWEKVIDRMTQYLDENINLIEQLKLLELNNHMFIDSLLHHNVNFFTVSPPEYPLDDIKNKIITFDGINDFVAWGLAYGGLLIQDVVNIKDRHLNLQGNKMVAEIIYNKLKEEGFDV